MALTILDYHRRARSLGFRATDCLMLAKKAFALDEASRLARLPPPGAASYEIVPDSATPVRLSFSIKVF